MTMQSDIGQAEALPDFLIEPSVSDYIQLMKPRVMTLVILTALAAMVAAPGSLHPVIGFIAILSIAVGAGASGALNMWYDADIDARMARTAARPLPRGRVSGTEALSFGTVLAVGSVMMLGVLVNWAAGALLALTIAFYVFVYTMWLKRRTPHNIVIGGAAGAFPPMVGWAAVTGDVSWAAVVMFAIIFMWTPPHFWALSLRLKDDYADAGVPMLPVTAGVRHTRIQIVLYSIALIPVTLLLIPTGDLRWIYLATAVVGGVLFVWKSYELYRRPADISPISVYKFSMLYLAVLFMAMGADAVIFG